MDISTRYLWCTLGSTLAGILLNCMMYQELFLHCAYISSISAEQVGSHPMNQVQQLPLQIQRESGGGHQSTQQSGVGKGGTSKTARGPSLCLDVNKSLVSNFEVFRLC